MRLWEYTAKPRSLVTPFSVRPTESSTARQSASLAKQRVLTERRAS